MQMSKSAKRELFFFSAVYSILHAHTKKSNIHLSKLFHKKEEYFGFVEQKENHSSGQWMRVELKLRKPKLG